MMLRRNAPLWVECVECIDISTPFPGSGAVHRQSIQGNDDADNNADDDGADQLTVTFAAAEGAKGGGFAGVAFKLFELFCTFFLPFKNKMKSSDWYRHTRCTSHSTGIVSSV